MNESQPDTDIRMRFRIVLVGKVGTLIRSFVQPHSQLGLVWYRKVLSHRKYFEHRQREGSF